MKIIITFLFLLCIIVKSDAQNYGQKKMVDKQYDLSTDVAKEVPITIMQVTDYVFDKELSIIFKNPKMNIIHANYEQETDALGGVSFVFYGNNNDKQTIQIFSDEIYYKYKGHYYKLLVHKIY